MKLWRPIPVFAVLGLLALACAWAQPAPVSSDSARRRTAGTLRIGPEDSITIQALDAEEISRTWRVGSSGELNLPMIGRIQAAGMTVEQLEQEILKRLKRYIREPQVTVFIAEFRSQPVTVTGGVAAPGIIQMQGRRTLFDAIVLAGGPKEAGPTVTVTRSMESGEIPLRGAHHDQSGKYSVIDLDLKEVMDGRSAAANLAIRPYDVISVSAFKQPRLVHILGEVNRPGAVELVTQDTVSLLKVVASAGGVAQTAAANKTMIVHVRADGLQTENAMINLKKIMAGKARDLELSAGDVVIIPPSQWKSYLQAASLSALNTGILVLARF